MIENVKREGSLPKILKYNGERFEKKPAIMEKRHGIWRPINWDSYLTSVKKIACGLSVLGLKQKEAVIIIGDNSSEWYCIELGVYALKGITIGLSSETSPSRILSIAKKFNVRFCFAESQEQVDKLIEVKSDIPSLEKIIYWKYRGLSNYQVRELLGIRELIGMGEENRSRAQSVIEDMIEETEPDDPCTVVFTSGTQGEPKGILYSHRRIIENAIRYMELDQWNQTDRLFPLFPPYSLVEKIFSIGCHLLSACVLYLGESPQTYLKDMREVKPTTVFLPGYAWEKILTRVQERVNRSDRLKRFAYRLFMSNDRRENATFYKRLINYFGEFIIYRPLRRHLGLTNVRFCYNTGPLLNREVFTFYHNIGVPLKNLYWTSESGFISLPNELDEEPENMGLPMRGIEVELSRDGEIVLVKGHNFNGYVDGQGVENALKNGSFYTGDAGFIKEDGKIRYLGRFENLITISGGEKFSTEILESFLRLNPLIKDAWIFGNECTSILYALIIVDDLTIRKIASKMGIHYPDSKELIQKKEILDKVKEEIKKINETMPVGKKILRFVVLPESFCFEDETISVSRKLRKGYLRTNYRDLIENLLNGKEKVFIALRRGKIREENEFYVNFIEEV
ncbi:MAG: AMP-binding protein [Deltaproteobacteria bacterium]|nr:AMP-binding protein [Deltaproteobacteria bacterium]